MDNLGAGSNLPLIFAAMSRLITALLAILLIASCRPTVYPPKPAGYFRIDTPAMRQYLLFDVPGFPYSFEYPSYSVIQKDTIYGKSGKIDNRFWINVYFKSFNAAINITYIEFSTRKQFDSLISGAYDLSFIHHEKWDYMKEQAFEGPSGAIMLYTIGGNSASRYQFTATDSVKHFMRGALYFDVTPNADSLQPATDFLEKDIEHMLASLHWKQN